MARSNTWQEQIPDLPDDLTLFDIALRAAEAWHREGQLHAQAAAGDIPPYWSPQQHKWRAEQCARYAVELQGWALMVEPPFDKEADDELTRGMWDQAGYDWNPETGLLNRRNTQEIPE